MIRQTSINYGETLAADGIWNDDNIYLVSYTGL